MSLVYLMYFRGQVVFSVCKASLYITCSSIMCKCILHSAVHSYASICMLTGRGCVLPSAAGRLELCRVLRRLSVRIMHVEIHPFICQRGLFPSQACQP